MKTTKRRSAREALAGYRDELRQRREARDAYLKLERELASYATQAEADDLLTAMSGHDDPEAQVVRDILTRSRHGRSSRLAS